MKSIYDEMEFSYIREMGDIKSHQPKNELVILLPVGCYWSKQNGSCSYCGYQNIVDSLQEKYAPIDMFDIVRHEMEKQTVKIDRVAFFVGGSFLEIRKDIRTSIIEYIADLNIEDVFFETRPELITSNNITQIKELLKDKNLYIAIGLESSDDYIRNDIHKKGISKDVFEKAISIIKDNGALPFVYVFVKPPIEYMIDTEAFKDAIDTIEYSFDCGAIGVELESGYIVENTDMHKMYLDNKYQPLKLWTIVELIKASSRLNKGFVRLAYFSDTPEPVAIPKNCDECSEHIYGVLNHYRKFMDISIFDSIHKCNCFFEWQSTFFINDKCAWKCLVK